MAINNDEIKELVRERYGARAQRVIELSPVVEHGDSEHADGCGCDVSASCCGPEDLEHALRLYNDGQLAGLPAESIAASAGCGNPTALAGLQPGERVLDLGSGGGIDCFLSAQQVGNTGRVTGLDMTPSMLELARKNQESLGLTNVEFVQGEMESMPLPSDSYDVIISNCVRLPVPRQGRRFQREFPGAGAGRPHPSVGRARPDAGGSRRDGCRIVGILRRGRRIPRGLHRPDAAGRFRGHPGHRRGRRVLDRVGKGDLYQHRQLQGDGQ